MEFPLFPLAPHLVSQRFGLTFQTHNPPTSISTHSAYMRLTAARRSLFLLATLNTTNFASPLLVSGSFLSSVTQTNNKSLLPPSLSIKSRQFSSSKMSAMSAEDYKLPTEFDPAQTPELVSAMPTLLSANYERLNPETGTALDGVKLSPNEFIKSGEYGAVAFLVRRPG